MSHMPALDNPERIDVTALEARVAALEAGGGSFGGVEVTMPDRSSNLGVAFMPSATQYTLCIYTIGMLSFNLADDDVGMFLMSDAAADPTTVRCKVSAFNRLRGTTGAATYTSARGCLTYICPPGHYLKLQPNLVGANAAASCELALEIKFL